MKISHEDLDKPKPTDGAPLGVPKYLEEINPSETAEQNIQHIGFSPGGLLFNDFEKIFNEVFNRRAANYREIVEVLSDGRRTFLEICDKLKVQKNGDILEYLNDLELSGFIAQDFVYNIKNGKQTKLNKYRLRDNFLRFYIKYIQPEESKIRKGLYKLKALENLPNWDGIMGLQFENTIQNNIRLVLKSLKLDSNIVLSASHYFQKLKKRNKGACDIDILITTLSSIYVCEIKFRKKIGTEVIAEVKEKIEKLSRPKNLFLRPVLIYQGELTEDLYQSDFFSSFIDAGQLMKMEK